MSKLQIVIADQDEEYTKSLADYLITNHTHRFEVITYNSVLDLSAYLNTATLEFDLLLLGENLDINHQSCFQQGTVVLLTEGNIPPEVNCRYLNKYQCGDILVKQMLEIYAQDNPNTSILPISTKKTRIVALCSPVGGAGKTSIALGASVQLTWTGKSVFYLNLETISSTGLFLEGQQVHTLSSVFYYLKHNIKNALSRIEAAKCVDSWYGITYFKRPDSAFDLQEDLKEELHFLIKQLAATGHYDRIFIDMADCLGKNSLAVFEACDDILVVCTQDVISEMKTGELIRELQILEQGGKKHSFTEKVSLILNKYEHSAVLRDEEIRYSGKNVVLKIPRVPGLLVPEGKRYRLDLNSAFGQAIHQLLQRF